MLREKRDGDGKVVKLRERLATNRAEATAIVFAARKRVERKLSRSVTETIGALGGGGEDVFKLLEIRKSGKRIERWFTLDSGVEWSPEIIARARERGW